MRNPHDRLLITVQPSPLPKLVLMAISRSELDWRRAQNREQWMAFPSRPLCGLQQEKASSCNVTIFLHDRKGCLFYSENEDGRGFKSAALQVSGLQ